MIYPKIPILGLFVVFIHLPLIGLSQFQVCNSNSITTLKDVVFLNENIGLVVGDSGTVLRSVDGGLNWQTVFTYDSIYLNKVRFFNAANAIATGSDILLSSDTGKTWQRLNVPDLYLDLEVLNDSTCVLSGIYKAILKSTDRGHSWDTLVSKNWNEEYGLLSFIDENIGYSCHTGGGNTNKLKKTRDGGKTWSDINTISGIDNSILESLEFMSEDIGYRAGWYNGHLMKTVDSAFNWTSANYTDTNFYGQLVDIHLDRNKPSVIYACGWYGDIVKSVDNGMKWYNLNSGVSNTTSLYGIYFLNDTLGWAVGTYGTVIRSVNGGGLLGISEPSEAEEITIFPNPGSGLLNISLPDNNEYSFEVFDLNGKRMLRRMTSNSGQAFLDLSHLRSGIYVINIEGDKINQQVKYNLVR